MSEGFLHYANLIKAENEHIYKSLEQKIHDPTTAFKANIWLPKATTVNRLRDSMTAYIDELRGGLKQNTETGDGRDAVERLFKKQGKAAELARRLMAFEDSALAVLNSKEFNDNPILIADITKTQAAFRNMFPIRKETPVAGYFNHLTGPGAIAMLNKIQTDIEVLEHMILEYIDNMTISYTDSCQIFRAIAYLNSNNLKAGQQLEVNAGIGSFSYAAKPIITVNGKKISLDAGGVAVYSQTVNQKPGKYFIPVRIEYVKPDGSRSSITKNLKYTVAE